MLTVEFTCPVCGRSYRCDSDSLEPELCSHVIFIDMKTSSDDRQTTYPPNSDSRWWGHSFTEGCSDVLTDMKRGWGGSHDALKNQLESIRLHYIEEKGLEEDEKFRNEIELFGIASPQPERIIAALEQYGG